MKQILILIFGVLMLYSCQEQENVLPQQQNDAIELRNHDCGPKGNTSFFAIDTLYDCCGAIVPGVQDCVIVTGVTALSCSSVYSTVGTSAPTTIKDFTDTQANMKTVNAWLQIATGLQTDSTICPSVGLYWEWFSITHPDLSIYEFCIERPDTCTNFGSIDQYIIWVNWYDSNRTKYSNHIDIYKGACGNYNISSSHRDTDCNYTGLSCSGGN